MITIVITIRTALIVQRIHVMRIALVCSESSLTIASTNRIAENHWSIGLALLPGAVPENGARCGAIGWAAGGAVIDGAPVCDPAGGITECGAIGADPDPTCGSTDRAAIGGGTGCASAVGA